jgi:hypothetical protein
MAEALLVLCLLLLLLLLLPLCPCVLMSCSTCALLPLTMCWLLTASTMSTWCDTCTESCWPSPMSAPQVSGDVQAELSGHMQPQHHRGGCQGDQTERVPCGSDTRCVALQQDSDGDAGNVQAGTAATDWGPGCTWITLLKWFTSMTCLLLPAARPPPCSHHCE